VTRFVVDASAVLAVLADGITVDPEHELVAPTLLRSEVLSRLHEAVARGELSPEVGLERLERIGRMGIRYLGDGVLRRVAWKIADAQGWDGTSEAEYLALTQLQAHALVTADAAVAGRAEGIVTVATLDDLTQPGP
jgi:predicted nucleic acid-binding protein